jgi:glycosyl hydrolase family 123
VRGIRLALVPALVLSAAAAAAPSASAAAGVGVVDSLQTVKPTASPSAASQARISAARNEFESFQVVISASGAPLRGVNVSLASPLKGPGGTIPQRNVRIYREAYLDITHPSDLEGSKGRWPDALIPKVDEFYGERRNAFPVDVPAGENRVAWIDVLVPPGEAAGNYSGSLRVTAGGGFSRTVPVELHVYPFGIPSTSTLQSTFGIDWEQCTAHYGNDCIHNEEKGWALKSLYVRAGLEDRISLSYVEYQPPVPGDESAWFKQYALPLIQGKTPENDAHSLLPMLLRGARLTSVQVDGGEYLGDWKREAKAGGFTSRSFLYACDEPNTDADTWRYCKRQARAARQGWPGLATLITTTIQNAKRFDATSLIDIIVPIVNEMDDKTGTGSPYAGNQRSKYNPFLSEPGNRLWLYTSCESHGCSGDPGSDPYWRGWPSYVIDQPASEERAMGFVSYEYGASGELYFAVDHDLKTAWTNQYDFGGNGDGTLFYPGTPARIGGKHDIPIDSIRLKRIRDGREDYEYLHILDRMGKRAQAMKVARGLFPTLYRTDVSATAFERARARLAALIAAG